MRLKIIKSILLISLIAAFYAYNSRPLLQSVREARFEAWLDKVEQKLRKGELNDSIHLKLYSNLESVPGDWDMTLAPSTSTPKTVQKILGVLRFIRASKAVRLPAATSQEPGLKLRIDSGKKHFEAFIPAETVSENIPLQSLLILLQEYSKEESSLKKESA